MTLSAGAGDLAGTMSYEYHEDVAVVGTVPSRGPLAGGTRVAVTGSNFRPDGLQCRFGSATAQSGDVRFVSTTMIECISPAALNPGSVALEVSVNEGYAFTAQGRSYLYETGAIVESVYPSRGFTGEQGQVVTVTGQHFEATERLSCRFGRTGGAVQAKLVSSSLLTCTAPAKDTGSMLVSVSLNGVDYGDSTARYVSSPPSSALALIPSLGPKSGGTVVRLSGAVGVKVEAVHACVFDGQSVRASVDAGQLTCSTPASAKMGRVSVQLTDVSGADVAGLRVEYEYIVQPAVTALVPSHGSIAGGGLLSVYGSDFKDGGLQCRFGTGERPAVAAMYVSSSAVQCITPAWGEPETVRVEVSVNDGADFSASGIVYEFERAPVVESLVPSRGTTSTAGQVVTVVGQNFVASEGLVCFFGDVSFGGAVFVSSTVMKCTAPEMPLGAVSVSVSTNGVERSLMSLMFEYAEERRVGTLVPCNGPSGGGTAVAIKLAGLFNAGEKVTCHFGSTSVIGAVDKSATSALCTAPAMKKSGTVKVHLVAESGGAETFGNADFEYYETPVVARTHHSRGTVQGGTTVRVFGTGFRESGLTCRFGDMTTSTDAAFYVSATEVACVSPSNSAGSATVEVSMNGGADFTTDGREYLYEAGTRVMSLYPSHGVAGEKGQTVTVVGENFEQTEGLSCRFGASSAVRAQYVSSSLVVCGAPARGAGTTQVSVSLNGVDGGLTGRAFVYVQDVVVTGITPSEGFVTGGTSVVLRVSGMTASNDGVRCVFGLRIVSGVLNKDGTVGCVTPSSQVKGKVQLKLEGYSGSSTFTYLDAPAVVLIQPSRGSLRGGATVSVVGTNLAGSSVQCRFSSTVVQGTRVRVVS